MNFTFRRQTHQKWHKLDSKIISHSSINNMIKSTQISYVYQPQKINKPISIIHELPSNTVPVELPKVIAKPIQQIKKLPYDLQKSLSIDIKSRYSTIRLSSKKPQKIQTMINLKTDQIEAQDQQTRKGIDLICVIDVSGSMKGQKIKLVKQTLENILHFVKPCDRLSLIKFNSTSEVLFQLMPITTQNKKIIIQNIKKLQAQGGTSIGKGLNNAFRLIKNRKDKIQNITSIFLLTDGLDDYAFDSTNKALKINQLQTENFTLNCFGFGNDHDQVQLNKICTLKQGSFYYIEFLETIKGCFANAIGGLLSVVGLNLTLYIRNSAFKPFQNIKISKTYGDMWTKEGATNGYAIKLAQISAGVQKGYICQMLIPPSDIILKDNQRRILVLEVVLQVQNKQKTKIIKKEANLIINFLNENQKLEQQLEQDGQVLQNYYRVIGAQILNEAMQLANSGNYQEGQNCIETIIQQIEKNKKVNQKKLKPILESLRQSKQKCQQYAYTTSGAKYMTTITRSFGNQQSTMVGNRQLFENKTQKRTVNGRI